MKLNIEYASFKGSNITEAWYKGSLLFKMVPVPTVSGNLTYNGNPQSPTISAYDSSIIQVSGNSATNAGDYTVTFHLKDTDRFHWEDGTTADKTAGWSITKLSLTIPSVSGGGTYKGSAYTATVSNFNGTWENQSGTVSATNAGTYTVTWSLKSTANTQWSDGTTTNKSKSWYISKADGFVNFNTSTYYDPTFPVQNKVISTSGGIGEFTWSQTSWLWEGEGFKNVSLNGDTVYIGSGSAQSVDEVKGWFTVKTPETTNYFAASGTFTVTVPIHWG